MLYTIACAALAFQAGFMPAPAPSMRASTLRMEVAEAEAPVETEWKGAEG